MKKDPNESFMHYQAKQILLSWLRDAAINADNEYATFCDIQWRVNRGAPHYGVFDEYPLLVGQMGVWDETTEFWDSGGWPDFEYMKNNHVPNSYKIADIAIQHKGWIVCVIEVVHKNEVSRNKLVFYKEHPMDPNVYEIPAHWIMSQIDIPKKMPKEFRIA